MGSRLERWVVGLYDVVFEPFLGPARREGLRLHEPPPGALVVDAGCGTGSHLRLYRDRGRRLAGIDLSPAMARAAARKLGSAASIQVGDASRMPYRGGCVDLVLLSMALHALPPALGGTVLAEAARVLKGNGRILVLDYHAGPGGSLRDRAVRAGVHAVERMAGGEHFANYRRYMTGGGLPPLAAAAGLRIDAAKAARRGSLGLYLLAAR
ncbi:MAG TPA: class I SAM-dependent methyltransferase [Vicinamibacterales bacterium]|nr:class I SAM-dependent methyltransferase [Vicinamibacterales bacterium]HOQ60802.1 class I SAM-dependent methyltransferase [Vicinamibacterales bacterium]HPK70591.1 class I SAM-dependent methyltransferase [Vicinamibacterales bacterium]